MKERGIMPRVRNASSHGWMLYTVSRKRRSSKVYQHCIADLFGNSLSIYPQLRIFFRLYLSCVPSVIWSLSISTRVGLRTVSRTITKRKPRDEASRATHAPETRSSTFYRKEPAMFLLLLIYRWYDFLLWYTNIYINIYIYTNIYTYIWLLNLHYHNVRSGGRSRVARDSLVSATSAQIMWYGCKYNYYTFV